MICIISYFYHKTLRENMIFYDLQRMQSSAPQTCTDMTPAPHMDWLAGKAMEVQPKDSLSLRPFRTSILVRSSGWGWKRRWMIQSWGKCSTWHFITPPIKTKTFKHPVEEKNHYHHSCSFLTRTEHIFSFSKAYSVYYYRLVLPVRTGLRQ